MIFYLLPGKKLIKGGRGNSHWSQYVHENLCSPAAFRKNLQNCLNCVSTNLGFFFLVRGEWNYDEQIPASKNYLVLVLVLERRSPTRKGQQKGPQGMGRVFNNPKGNQSVKYP